MEKNCHNCKFGLLDSDFDELNNKTNYFMVCKKRGDESGEFESNLSRPEYLEKGKRCCELNN